MFNYIIAVGTNINAEYNLQQAWLLIKKRLDKNSQMAPLLATKARGDSSQPDYINTAFTLHSELSVPALKQELLAIEQKLKRVRTSNKNAARTIDLDICCCDGKIVDDDYYQYDFVQKSADYFLDNT